MNQEKIKKIAELRDKIAKLPRGYVSAKQIGNDTYFYLQWTENGKKYSKYINEADLSKISALIQERRKLEEELKLLKRGYAVENLIPCTLMHLNKEVATLWIDKDNGFIITVQGDVAINHSPIGTVDESGAFSISKLKEWWIDRSIPASRSGIKEALERLNISTTHSLLLRCYGLSLSDQYWIKPKGENLKWEDINFFDNDFSEDVGTILLGGENIKKDLDLSSPDNTSVGNLKKRWKIVDGRRVMLKGGSSPYRQEPYNEVIASRIAKLLGIPCVEYSLIYNDDYPYSICEDFVDKHSDLISAYSISLISKRNNNESTYAHLLKCFKHVGLDNAEDYFNKLITFDFIIGNEDRHLNNFGIIRDATDLGKVSFAPIFDSGASFGFNKLSIDISPFKDIESKPFKSNPLEQLKLVTSFDWIDINKLNYIKKNIRGWFMEYESKYLDKPRVAAISNSVITRIDYIINLLKNK